MATMIMDRSIFTVILVHLCCLIMLTSHLGICMGSSEILCIPSEREALLTFKHHLKDPSNRLSSWSASNPNCCKWIGVVCSNITGHILQLHLISPPSSDHVDDTYERSMFGGEVNPSLVDLKHLNYLDLSGNDFGGMQIPGFLCEITTLTYLNLSDAGFYGKIPHQIGNLSNLLFLDLNYAANGTIPHQIGNLTNLLYLGLQSYYKEPLHVKNLGWLSGLSSLQYLDLSYANLSESFDWVESMQALPSLVELRLLDGSFNLYNQPSIVNFSSLVSLSISVCPKWIFGLKKLVSLQLLSYVDSIPDGIQNLTLLENLDLSVDLNSSSIPAWLYGLHHLKVLNLHRNNLGGTISNALGNLTSLVSLDLSSNQLEGMIPTSLGNLTSLVSLDLSMNQLKGMIPTTSENLASLVGLDLSGNQLEGMIPKSFGNLTPLISLALSNNKLEGIIPTSLGNLASLVSLDLSYNKLEGMIPTSLGNLTSLVNLDLSSNKLEGMIPTSLKNLCNLREISLSNLTLSGHLTNQIGMFENLVELDFSGNSIRGSLPTSLGKLSSLRYLDLNNNQFNGNPFEILGSLSNLSSLFIEDNLFEGVVMEDDLANLTSLKVFYGSGNNLSLKVGPDWRPTFQAIGLAMDSWNLGPHFPLWIQSQKNLEFLYMSNTGISDSIPTWFWGIFRSNWSELDLDLSHNHMHGEIPIPNSLQNPILLQSIDLSSNNFSDQLPHLSTHVIQLDLSSNYFSGSMTDFLCKNHDGPNSLEFLNVASNNLSGEIPDCWMMWPNLVDLNIESNYFVGNLPPSMASVAWLESLQIRNNRLSGTFPPILKNTSQLIFLDLAENNFTGIIPAWVGERLLNLKILCFRSNKFFGNIPNQICALSYLQVLDLAQNNLSGNLPSCFNNLSALMLKNKSRNSFIYSQALNGSTSGIISALLWLKGRGVEYKNLLGMVTSVDLSNNNLSGEIPEQITNLDGLIFLNLSKNQLAGQIPESIGNMRSLESIDFSRNKLCGKIPETMSNLSFLSMMDLSYNHLEGKIPTGTQLQTLAASDFVGNNLCGPPLPANCSPSEEIPKVGHKEEKKGGHGVNWFFVSMAFGFIVGFWVVVAPLFIYRSWRHAYFLFLDAMWYKLQSCWDQ